MSDHFAVVYEATAHRITGLVSNTALDLVGVGPGTRILDIAAGAWALSGPAAERGATVLATDFAPGMVWRLSERLRPFRRCEARQMDGEALPVPDASFLSNPTYRTNARKLQKAIASANGLSVAADLIEHSLGVTKKSSPA